MDTITSIKDPRVVEARALTSASGRNKTGKILLEGSQIIEWALAAGLAVEHIFLSPGTEAPPSAVGAGIPLLPTTEGILKKISGTKYLIPEIGVAAVSHSGRGSSTQEPLVLVLDGVVDHGNIGTIIRTAKAFGIDTIYNTNTENDLYYKKIISASRGSVFQVSACDLPTPDETLAHLKQAGYQIVATSPHAAQLQSSLHLEEKPVALVIGNETEGVSDVFLKQADALIQIPMSGPVESLNVGVAAGISVYEIKLKAVIAMLTNHIRSTLGRNVNVAGQLIQLALDVRLAQVTDLNSTQVILMMVLQCDQVMTLAQVSRDTAVFDTELENLLAPLHAKGYIQAVESEAEDAIRLTEAGAAQLGQLWGVIEATEHEILAGFTPPEKQQFSDFLRRVQDNCIAITGEQGPA